jgi:hypothetical protein
MGVFADAFPFRRGVRVAGLDLEMGGLGDRFTPSIQPPVWAAFSCSSLPYSRGRSASALELHPHGEFEYGYSGRDWRRKRVGRRTLMMTSLRAPLRHRHVEGLQVDPCAGTSHGPGRPSFWEASLTTVELREDVLLLCLTSTFRVHPRAPIPWLHGSVNPAHWHWKHPLVRTTAAGRSPHA